MKKRNRTVPDIEVGIAHHRAGRLQEAKAIYRQMPDHPDAQHLLGVIANQMNRHEEAIELISKAISAQPTIAAYYFSIGAAYRALNRLDDVVACYRQVLAHVPDNADAHNNLGNALKDQGKADEAATCYLKALEQRPDFAEAHNNLGIILAAQGKLDEAVSHYERAIVLKPDFAEAHNNLGLIFADQDQADAATECYRKALACKPDFAEAHNNLGLSLKEQGKLDDAIASYLNALELKPNSPEMHNNLGLALKESGQLADAVTCYLNALTLKPDFAQAYNNLGLAFSAQGNPNGAIECYQAALSFNSHSAEAHNNLGIELREQGKLLDALSCFRTALGLKPAYADAYCNLGITYQMQGKSDEAIACCRTAMSLKSGYTDAWQILLLAMQYSAAYTPAEVSAEHRSFGARFETWLKPPHANSREPNKRLKIGYVSPDFRKHAVAYFIEPVLTWHDKSQVEVFCYYNHTQYDPVTQRLQALADHWVPCKHLSDEQLAQRIRADGIDILIDLAGHTAGTRLLAFARKPAPVQVTYLGYPGTTGLTAIDYRLTDVHAEPPGMTEHLNVEQLWRLPEFFCCYRPSDNSPAVAARPLADANGFVTFGCFNNFAKVTDPVLALWARLLARVPTARLMLEIRGVDDPQLRAEIETRLARLGIPLERLILVPRKPENQYVLYNQIDIALDPFPLHGGTTSMDAVWMAVPFVTLAGQHFSSRMGVTILTNAGMPELIAQSEEEYIEIAAALAQDQIRLRAFKAGLRDWVRDSPLMDAQGFTRHMEQAYRGMWRAWCLQADADGHDEGKKPLYS